MNILYREIIYRIIKIDRNEKYTHTNRPFRIIIHEKTQKRRLGFSTYSSTDGRCSTSKNLLPPLNDPHKCFLYKESTRAT